MYNAGLLQAGPDGCCLVAADDVWYEPELDTFAGDSVAARNAVATLLGNLALLAPQGGRGLPIGHVVAYKASPELQLQFIRAMAAKCGEWGHAPVSD